MLHWGKYSLLQRVWSRFRERVTPLSGAAMRLLRHMLSALGKGGAWLLAVHELQRDGGGPHALALFARSRTSRMARAGVSGAILAPLGSSDDGGNGLVVPATSLRLQMHRLGRRVHVARA